MYPEFAKTAREEGLEAAAMIFEAIAVAEKQHEKRYLGLAANIEAGQVFKRGEAVTWRCRNCGYIFEGQPIFAVRRQHAKGGVGKTAVQEPANPLLMLLAFVGVDANTNELS